MSGAVKACRHGNTFYECPRCEELWRLGSVFYSGYGPSGRWIHDLKILISFYEQVRAGVKLFEIRRNDRDFQVGDWLSLKQWDGAEYTGAEMLFCIDCMTDFEQKPGFVVLGISRVLLLRAKAK